MRVVSPLREFIFVLVIGANSHESPIFLKLLVFHPISQKFPLFLDQHFFILVDLVLELLHFLILVILEEAVVLHLMAYGVEVLEEFVLLLVDVVAVSPSLKVLDVLFQVVFDEDHLLTIFSLLVGPLADFFD